MHLMTALDLSSQDAISIKYAAFSFIDLLYIQIQRKCGPLAHTRAHKRNTGTSLLAVRFINWMFVHSQSDLGLWREVKEVTGVCGGARERERDRKR